MNGRGYFPDTTAQSLIAHSPNAGRLLSRKGQVRNMAQTCPSACPWPSWPALQILIHV